MSVLDWNAIERAYRLGDKSLRELAREHGCSDTAIRKRAAQYNWKISEIAPIVAPREPITSNTCEPPEELSANATAKVTVSQFQLAEIAGVTRQTIRLWTQEGLPFTEPSPQRMNHDLVTALAWIRENKKTDDKERLARIKADDAQLDLDLKLHSLMRVSEATKVWEGACASMRARILSVPPVAQQRLGLTVAQVQELTGLVHEALEVLSGRMDAPPEDPEEEEPEEKPRPAGHKKPGRPRREH